MVMTIAAKAPEALAEITAVSMEMDLVLAKAIELSKTIAINRPINNTGKAKTLAMETDEL